MARENPEQLLSHPVRGGRLATARGVALVVLAVALAVGLVAEIAVGLTPAELRAVACQVADGRPC
jgi:hypothetical protein